MRVLFDTHAFIWWDSEPTRLSAKALDLCRNPGNVLLLSVASVWEMEIKRQLGKLTLRTPLAEIVEHQHSANGLILLDVQLPHVLRLADLPPIHKDPFDRLLVAQALAEAATLVTADPVVRQYPAPVLW